MNYITTFFQDHLLVIGGININFYNYNKMKKSTNLLFVLTLIFLITSCGGNTRTSTTEKKQNSDTANVATQNQSPEITTEKEQNGAANVATQNQPPEMTISISDKEPCDGGSFILKIKGGTPFSNEKPFIVESKHIGGDEGSVYLGKFTNKNGAYTMKIGTGARGLESKQQLIVTDSKGIKKIVNFTIHDCP